jgi:hypothetical protein
MKKRRKNALTRSGENADGEIMDGVQVSASLAVVPGSVVVESKPVEIDDQPIAKIALVKVREPLTAARFLNRKVRQPRGFRPVAAHQDGDVLCLWRPIAVDGADLVNDLAHCLHLTDFLHPQCDGVKSAFAPALCSLRITSRS